MTATQSSWIGGWHATTDFFANGSLYIGLGQTLRGGNLTVEANVQRKAILAYTLQALSCKVTSSTTGANVTSLKLRKNTANGNMSVVLTSSVTGWIQDSTHTDSIAIGDLINEAFVGTSASPDCNIITTAVDVLGSSSAISEFTWSALGPTDANSYSLSGSTDTFTQLSGGTAAIGAGETTETDTSKMTVRAAGTYRGLQAALTTNTSGSSIKFHNNGATGNQTISPATATGTVVLTQDSTHTDSVLAGDKADYVFNAATHTMNTLWVGCTTVGAASKHDVFLSEQSQTTSIGTSDVFMATGGSWGTNPTQSQAQTPTIYALTISRLRIHVKTNSQSNATTFLGNTGGVNMTSTVAIGAGTTGVLEDTTHTDSIVSGHNINYQFKANAGTGTLIYDWAGALMDDGSNTGVVNGTGSGAPGTITLSGPTGAAKVSNTGRGAPGTITLSAPAGHATAGTGATGSGAPGTITLAAPTGTATGGAGATGSGAPGTITLSAPTGRAAAGATATGAPGTITTTAPAGRALGNGPRSTQAPVLAVGRGDSAARASQGAIMALSEVRPDAHASEAAILALGVVVPAAEVTQTAILSLVDVHPCGTRRADVWVITRRDGMVLGFTGHDQDLMFGEVVCHTCGSLTPSATESGSQIGHIGSVELDGILNSDLITEADLFGGLYDDALVEVWRIPWDDADTATPVRIAAGWAGSIQHGVQGFKIEVLGPGSRLGQQPLVKPYTPGCRWVFGSPAASGCGFDREGARLAGGVVSASNRAIFIAEGLVDPGSPFLWGDGLVRFTYGPNTGVELEVKQVDFGTGQVMLWIPAPFLPEPGDIFELLPGCPKTTDACHAYNRYLNYGGYPDVPGNDLIGQTPDAKYF